MWHSPLGSSGGDLITFTARATTANQTWPSRPIYLDKNHRYRELYISTRLQNGVHPGLLMSPLGVDAYHDSTAYKNRMWSFIRSV